MKKFISVMLILSLCLTSVNVNSSAYEVTESNFEGNVTDVVESLENCTKKTRNSWARKISEMLFYLGVGARIGKKFNNINKGIHAYDGEGKVTKGDEDPKPGEKLGFWKWLFGGLLGGRPEGRRRYVPGVIHIPFFGGGSNDVKALIQLKKEISDEQLIYANAMTDEAFKEVMEILNLLIDNGVNLQSNNVDVVAAVLSYVVSSRSDQVKNFTSALNPTNTQQGDMGHLPDVLRKIIDDLKKRNDDDKPKTEETPNNDNSNDNSNNTGGKVPDAELPRILVNFLARVNNGSHGFTLTQDDAANFINWLTNNSYRYVVQDLRGFFNSDGTLQGGLTCDRVMDVIKTHMRIWDRHKKK